MLPLSLQCRWTKQAASHWLPPRAVMHPNLPFFACTYPNCTLIPTNLPRKSDTSHGAIIGMLDRERV